MEALKDIANIAGKSGLYRILKPSRSGMIVESMDGHKEKFMIGPNARVSVLKDIAVYTDDDEQSVSLDKVFRSIYEKYGNVLPVNAKTASSSELATFIGEVVPNYDRDRVHISDVKKLIGWYSILQTHTPDMFTELQSEAEAVSKESVNGTSVPQEA